MKGEERGSTIGKTMTETQKEQRLSELVWLNTKTVPYYSRMLEETCVSYSERSRVIFSKTEKALNSLENRTQI